MVGSAGIKLVCQDLDDALAGSSMFKYSTEEEVTGYEKELQTDIKRVKKMIKL